MFSTSLGCGGSDEEIPSLAPVSGVITMDGSPLVGALVQFEPKIAAKPAIGTTDSEGKYSLQYGGGDIGAAIGSHIVSIFHYGDDPEIPEEGKVPAKYGTESTLTADVKEGENEFDFDLESK